MVEAKSRRSFTYLAASILVVSSLALLARFSCSGSHDVADVPKSAVRTADGTPASADDAGRPGSATAVDGSPAAAGQADELNRAWEDWRTEYEYAVEEVERLTDMPMGDRDRESIRRARKHARDLLSREPVNHEPPTERGPRQPLTFAEAGGENGNLPARRLADNAEYSDDVRDQLRDLPKERRKWLVANRLELDALWAERETARVAGDAAAEANADEKLKDLTDTAPSLFKILPE
jgi:hypothetical protein